VLDHRVVDSVLTQAHLLYLSVASVAAPQPCLGFYIHTIFRESFAGTKALNPKTPIRRLFMVHNEHRNRSVPRRSLSRGNPEAGLLRRKVFEGPGLTALSQLNINRCCVPPNHIRSGHGCSAPGTKSSANKIKKFSKRSEPNHGQIRRSIPLESHFASTA